jgi:hypothetical protein
VFAVVLAAAPVRAQAAPDSTEWSTAAVAASGQELIYHGRFEAAGAFFAQLAARYPKDPVGPALAASALIWDGAAREDDAWAQDSVDALLNEAANRAERALAGAATDSARVAALFWLGTALGYRARQAELHGHLWGAAGDAKGMRRALGRALAMDSSCVDCLLGLAIYDYALARAGLLARLVARIIGLGGGDAELALARLRRVSEEGTLTRYEAQWVYANALWREGGRDAALREEARRIVASLAAEFPDNPVFGRFLESTAAAP